MKNISVCMATHNGETYLRDQIDSILNQLGPNDELVISDDGSTDDTLSIINSYDDSRIILVFSHYKNNAILNFENALSNCSGDIIFLSDQDDIWDPDKIVIMVGALMNSDLVLCDCSLVSNNLEILYPSLFNINNTQKGVVRNFVKNGYVGCCMAFKRKVLEKAIPFPSSIPMHDQWIGLVAERYFKTTHINDKLVQYRRHVGTSTSTGKRSSSSFASKLKHRYTLFSGLIRLGL